MLVLFFFLQFSHGQTTKQCDSPEGRKFDFWLGQWDLEWVDAKGDRVTGSNIIKSLLDGYAILENFDGSLGDDLKGMGVSTYDMRSGKWKKRFQTVAADPLHQKKIKPEKNCFISGPTFGGKWII